MTGRSFASFSTIVILLITVWTPLVPEIYVEFRPASTDKKPDSTSKKSITADTRMAPSTVDTTANPSNLPWGKRTNLWLKIVGAFVIVGLTTYTHYVKDYRPFIGYDELRKDTLDYVFKPFHESMKSKGLEDLRLTIMQRKCWIRFTRFVQFGRLVPIYHLGAYHQERDKSLSYWYLKLFALEFKQGITGQAFLAERDVIVNMEKFRDKFTNASISTSGNSQSGVSSIWRYVKPSPNAPNRIFGWLYDESRLGLTNYRIDVLSDMKMIISMYMISWRGRSYRCMGTINIESANQATTRLMFDNDRGDQIRQDLQKHVKDVAPYVSRWL